MIGSCAALFCDHFGSAGGAVAELVAVDLQEGFTNLLQTKLCITHGRTIYLDIPASFDGNFGAARLAWEARGKISRWELRASQDLRPTYVAPARVARRAAGCTSRARPPVQTPAQLATAQGREVALLRYILDSASQPHCLDDHEWGLFARQLDAVREMDSQLVLADGVKYCFLANDSDTGCRGSPLALVVGAWGTAQAAPARREAFTSDGVAWDAKALRRRLDDKTRVLDVWGDKKLARATNIRTVERLLQRAMTELIYEAALTELRVVGSGYGPLALIALGFADSVKTEVPYEINLASGFTGPTRSKLTQYIVYLIQSVPDLQALAIGGKAQFKVAVEQQDTSKAWAVSCFSRTPPMRPSTMVPTTHHRHPPAHASPPAGALQLHAGRVAPPGNAGRASSAPGRAHAPRTRSQVDDPERGRPRRLRAPHAAGEAA